MTWSKIILNSTIVILGAFNAILILMPFGSMDGWVMVYLNLSVPSKIKYWVFLDNYYLWMLNVSLSGLAAVLGGRLLILHKEKNKPWAFNLGTTLFAVPTLYLLLFVLEYLGLFGSELRLVL